MPTDQAPERTTALDRPPEEAAEDTSFARGLRVLLTVADRGEVRADELSTLLETPISTIYRYLRTLAMFGFIDRYGGGYRLGPRLIIGHGAIVTSEELTRVATPVLQLLAEETGETVVIARRIGSSVVCLHEVPSHHPLRVSLEPGSAWPLHAGAIGKVLLAYAPPEILDEVLANGVTPVTAASPDETELRRHLEEIVSTGVGRSEGEVVSGSVSIAVPIMRDDGIVAAIGVVSPVGRASLAWRTRVARLLQDAARTVAGSIGT
jgi:IclR family transcriptional regulator, acetate operon repressor